MAISEIDALKAIDEALSSLDSDARGRVLNWANSKYNAGYEVVNAPTTTTSSTKQKVTKTSTASTSKSKSKATGKSSTALKQLKELKFHPTGKQSFAEFIAIKKPSSQKQKCTVAIYYMINEMDIDAVSPNHVYTAFKAAGWPIPSNLMNTMHQAGTEGWLDTENATAIKVTHIGENLVEHTLPKTSK